MRLFGLEIRASKPAAEARSDTVMSSDPRLAEIFGLESFSTASDVVVTVDSALSVPAVFRAVSFLAGTIATLPVHVYSRNGNARETVPDHPVSRLLKGAVNPGLTSYDWRKLGLTQHLSRGRHVSFIERDAGGKIINLWPLVPSRLTIKVNGNDRQYFYRNGEKTVTYGQDEVIDLPYMLQDDGVKHRSPILSNKEVIGLAIAATKFGASYFGNGGVPPFVIHGAFQSGRAMSQASNDFEQALQNVARDKRRAIVLPNGLTVTSIGKDAKDSQLLELKKFLVAEIARVFGLPPAFLQDLEFGTYSNTEQQDLQLTKHTLAHIVAQIEAEMTLKFFGRDNEDLFVAFNLDGLMRGDLKSRTEAFAQAVFSGQITPNEVRRIEDRPDMPNGNDLLIQGATVPLGTQPTSPNGGTQ